jgi:hypothetical protein
MKEKVVFGPDFEDVNEFTNILHQTTFAPVNDVTGSDSRALI